MTVLKLSYYVADDQINWTWFVFYWEHACSIVVDRTGIHPLFGLKLSLRPAGISSNVTCVETPGLHNLQSIFGGQSHSNFNATMPKNSLRKIIEKVRYSTGAS